MLLLHRMGCLNVSSVLLLLQLSDGLPCLPNLASQCFICILKRLYSFHQILATGAELSQGLLHVLLFSPVRRQFSLGGRGVILESNNFVSESDDLVLLLSDQLFCLFELFCQKLVLNLVLRFISLSGEEVSGNFFDDIERILQRNAELFIFFSTR